MVCWFSKIQRPGKKKKTRRQKKKIPNGKKQKTRGSWTTQPTTETRKEHGRPNRRKSDEHAKCSIDTRMGTRNNPGTDRPDTPEKPTRKRTKKAAEPLPII